MNLYFLDTKADLKKLRAAEDNLFIVKETNKGYRWLENGSSYTVDDIDVIATRAGGTTRWISISAFGADALFAGPNVTITPVIGGKQISASAAASTNYIFWPSAPAQAGNVYKVFADMMTAIAALPSGEIPRVIFRESFTIPTVGMPVGGWDMRLGVWASPIIATGSVTITCPDGVIIDNLITAENGLAIDAQPTTADGMFTYSMLGGLSIFVEALGAKLANTGSKALIASGSQVVYVRNNSSNIGVGPASTAPLVKLTAPAVILAMLFGESPNCGWENGDFEGPASSQIMFIHGVHFNMPTIPGWLGDAPIELNDSQAKNLIYNDSAQLPASGASTVQGVIDWLKTQIGGGGGGANQYEIVFDPAAATETDNLKNTFDTLMQRVALLSPEPVTITVRKPGLNQVISVPTTGMPGLGWDFEKIIFRTSPDSPGVKLDFADGTYMQQVPRAMAGLQMQFNETTSPVASITGAAIIALEDAGFINAGSQPIFQVNGGFLYFVSRGVFAPFGKSGATEAVDIQSGSMQVDIITQSLTNGLLATSNQISGPAGSATFNVYTLVPGGYNRTDANFSGSTTVNMHAETRVNQLIAGGAGASGNGVFSAGDFAFAAVVNPSGFVGGSWAFQKVGKLCFLQIFFEFGSVGSAVSTITVNNLISYGIPATQTGLPDSDIPGSVAADAFNVRQVTNLSGASAAFECDPGVTASNQYRASFVYPID